MTNTATANPILATVLDDLANAETRLRYIEREVSTRRTDIASQIESLRIDLRLARQAVTQALAEEDRPVEPIVEPAPVVWKSRKAWGTTEYYAEVGEYTLVVERNATSRPTACGRWKGTILRGDGSRVEGRFTAQTARDLKHRLPLNLADLIERGQA